ncbi:hypothetical protein Tco_0631931, partial [Tanacetum coccineum]
LASERRYMPGTAKRELRLATQQAFQLLQDNYLEFVAKQVHTHMGGRLTSGDKSLDLSAFKLSRLFFSLLSSGFLVVGDYMGLSESIARTH